MKIFALVFLCLMMLVAAAIEFRRRVRRQAIAELSRPLPQRDTDWDELTPPAVRRHGARPHRRTFTPSPVPSIGSAVWCRPSANLQFRGEVLGTVSIDGLVDKLIVRDHAAEEHSISLDLVEAL